MAAALSDARDTLASHAGICREVRRSRVLAEVLHATLRVGNFMNYGSRQVRVCYDSGRETSARKAATFYFAEACGTSRDGRKLLARDRICSEAPWYLAHSETHGF
jgi:hypothetical protein